MKNKRADLQATIKLLEEIEEAEKKAQALKEDADSKNIQDKNVDDEEEVNEDAESELNKSVNSAPGDDKTNLPSVPSELTLDGQDNVKFTDDAEDPDSGTDLPGDKPIKEDSDEDCDDDKEDVNEESDDEEDDEDKENVNEASDPDKDGDDDSSEDGDTDDDKDKVNEASDDEDDEDKEDVNEESDDDEDGMDDEDKDSMNEALDSLFKGKKLSESFKKQIKTIFEEAVTRVTKKKVNEQRKSFQKQYKNAVAKLHEDTDKKVDKYLDYVISEWKEENKIALNEGIKTTLIESFIAEMYQVFEKHWIDIPESKVDLVEYMRSQNATLRKQVNEQAEKLTNLNESFKSHKVASLVEAVAEDLTDVQKEKFNKLVENIEYTTAREFADKLVDLKKTYFSESSKKKVSAVVEQKVDEVLNEDENDPYISEMLEKGQHLFKG